MPPETAQNRFIADARAVLRPSEVKLHRVPGWLRLRLLKAFGCRDHDTSGCGVLQHAMKHLAGNGWLDGWMDHWGSSTIGDRRVFVAEPYTLTLAEHGAIERLCAAIDCECWLSSNSWWYPGHTLRIVITPKREDV